MKIVVVMKIATYVLLRGGIMDATPLNTKLKALRTTLGRAFSSKKMRNARAYN